MSDYMAQKMDDQITGAISENERLSGVLHVAVQLLRKCLGPMEVSAAVLESETSDDGLEVLIEQVRKFCNDAAMLQAAPPAPAMHASAPTGLKCADCHMDKEACPTCYEAWWKARHPNSHQMPDVAPPAPVAVHPAPVSPSIYDALPPGAMDWLTSTDPRGAASREWQEGWDACRNRVHSQVDAAVAAPDASPSPAPVAAPVVTDAPQLPEGFRLLPVEATDSMMDAEWNVSMSEAHSNGGVSAAAWRAMVEAAPQVTYGDGHSGVGWYMHDTDYPEEGAVFLSRAILAAQSGAPQ